MTVSQFVGKVIQYVGWYYAVNFGGRTLGPVHMIISKLGKGRNRAF